uniref:Secreted protein n=1 Tax=Schistosoma curassoni TaxID=6186 RepID=A0A183KT05_9TREM
SSPSSSNSLSSCASSSGSSSSSEEPILIAFRLRLLTPRLIFVTIAAARCFFLARRVRSDVFSKPPLDPPLLRSSGSSNKRPFPLLELGPSSALSGSAFGFFKRLSSPRSSSSSSSSASLPLSNSSKSVSFKVFSGFRSLVFTSVEFR